MPSFGDAGQLKRSVFQTFCQNSSGTWEFHSAAEIGFDLSQRDKPCYVMLFRDKEGNTRDISQAIQLTPDVANNGDCNIRLASSTDASTSLPTELRVGFEMGVRLSGGVPKGFEGKLGQSAWKGQFVCTSSLPFAAIVEGEKPLPDNVKSFLDITPLVTKTADGRTDTVDQARLSAKDIFKEIMLHALSDKAKELYFDKLQDLGSGTINGGQALPTKLQDASFPFAFTKILSDDKSVLYICAMHLLCRALKNSGWLEQKYKDGIKDDCDVFFANLTSKTVDNSTLPQWIKAGPEVVAILRSQFIDAMNRCYFAAYICVNQSIVNYFQDPTSIYDQVKATILSANYKAYWIPKTIGAAQDTSAQMLRIRLGILHDKLVMLLAVAQRYQGSWQGQTPDVDNIINQLAQAAKETGLVDLTNVNLQPETITFTPGSIYSDETMSTLWRFSMAELSSVAPEAAIYSRPIDMRQYDTNNFLDKEATPIGLYHEPPIISSVSDCIGM